MESPRTPSVPETVRAYARRFFLGDASGWRGTPLTLVLFVGAILMVAPVSATEHLLPVALAIFVAVAAVDAAYSEYLFGGPVS